MIVLVIGLWYHARRIYLPYLHQLVENGSVDKVIGIDIVWNINEETIKSIIPSIEILYIGNTNRYKVLLNKINKKYNIDATIIATDPINHKQYLLWSLDNNISCITDKPIVLEEDVIKNYGNIKKMDEAFNKILWKAENLQWKIKCEIMCQRRFHKWYLLAKEKIVEIFLRTNCPVTYINSFHCDWQWRFPDEIVEQNYHPYSSWYGKVWHSWYHTIDIVSRFAQSTTNIEKDINNIEVFAHSAFPNDLLYQFNFDDYKKLFSSFNSTYTTNSFANKTKWYWDADTHISVLYKNNDHVQTIGSINLLHNWFSQRNWMSTDWRDLYKGNWRIRQETILIEQWPFQSIFIESFQSSELNKDSNTLYKKWWEMHFDIHIYRNNSLFPEYKKYEYIWIKDLYKDFWKWYSRWHNETARRDWMKEFFGSILWRGTKTESDILNHKLSTTVFHSVYKSINKHYNWKNNLIKATI